MSFLLSGVFIDWLHVEFHFQANYNAIQLFSALIKYVSYCMHNIRHLPVDCYSIKLGAIFTFYFSEFSSASTARVLCKINKRLSIVYTLYVIFTRRVYLRDYFIVSF